MSSFTREGDITNAPLARGRGASARSAVKNKGISGGVTSCAAGLPLHSKRREALCSAHMLASEPSSPHQHLGMHREPAGHADVAVAKATRVSL